MDGFDEQEVSPTMDATMGLIFRLNILWRLVDIKTVEGDYDAWNSNLDGIYKNLGFENPVDIKKSDDVLLEAIQTLRKRLDEIESKPMPRKYRMLEKSFGPSEKSTDNGLEVDMQKCLELRKSEQNGKKLTADDLDFIQKTLNKSMNTKFSS